MSLRFLLIFLLLFPLAAFAQDEVTWDKVATRAENLVQTEDATNFALNQLRDELVVWRDEFGQDIGLNSERLATVAAQIAALGPAPAEGEEEPAVIAVRRDTLLAQRDTLLVPGILAEEAHARANGLIAELDAQVRAQQTGRLFERGPIPINPAELSAGTFALWDALKAVWSETARGVRREFSNGMLLENLPRAGLFFALAFILMGHGRRWVTQMRNVIEDRESAWTRIWLFLLSFGQILLPVIGLFLLTEALETLQIFGRRSGEIVGAVPIAGFIIVFTWWLNSHIFPLGRKDGPLSYDEKTRNAGRKTGIAIAWIMALGVLVEVGLETADVTTTTRAAIRFPMVVILGLLFWRFGRVIKTVPQSDADDEISRSRMRRYIGGLAVIVAVLSPLLALAGFGAAAQALLGPAILSLALIAVVLLLQRMAFDLTGTSEGEDGVKSMFALVPVLISFALFVVSLPIFALIWGARVDDLLEVWTRFREGFTIGESRISPTDFLTFVVVFVLGYLLTRFIQSTLRKSVMPRTKLDLGGQNAIVAGIGYVGIILAAVIAVTSAGIDLSNLAIVAGALSVGIGFGLQNIVSNFVSGIILLIERPVSEGDWIEVDNKMGYVRAISVRSTRIETFDRTDVIIPNADLVSNKVTNWTRGNLVGRLIVKVGVAYGSDIDQVKGILESVAQEHPLVLRSPPPAVLFMEFGDNSLNFEIRAILRDVNYMIGAHSEMNIDIAKRFAAAGIEIPFPQRDVWLRTADDKPQPDDAPKPQPAAMQRDDAARMQEDYGDD